MTPIVPLPFATSNSKDSPLRPLKSPLSTSFFRLLLLSLIKSDGIVVDGINRHRRGCQAVIVTTPTEFRAVQSCIHAEHSYRCAAPHISIVPDANDTLEYGPFQYDEGS